MYIWGVARIIQFFIMVQAVVISIPVSDALLDARGRAYKFKIIYDHIYTVIHSLTTYKVTLVLPWK